jgi:5-azacytidine-induced protein 1
VTLQEQAAESTRKQLNAQSAQHEAASRQLKERLLREQEDALDRERVASQNRLREASERYEQQLQSQRMRLIADQVRNSAGLA